MTQQSVGSDLPPLEQFADKFRRLTSAIGSVVLGQEQVVEELLIAALARGHVLIEGVPGLGKTRLVRAFAEATDLDFARIQFTPDLMPADVTGTTVFMEANLDAPFEFQPGPVFTHVLLADEINRATPKSQSALLEAMQERAVTVAGKRHSLPEPFMVLATQNPVDHEGTFPLPESQLDRFLMRISMGYPDRRAELDILARMGDDADALDQDDLARAMEGVDVAYYLIHSLGSGPEFEARDRRTARTFGTAARTSSAA